MLKLAKIAETKIYKKFISSKTSQKYTLADTISEKFVSFSFLYNIFLFLLRPSISLLYLLLISQDKYI